MILGVVSQPVLLTLVLADEAAGFFPQVTVYDDTGAIDTGPIDMSDRGGGLYQATITASATAGDFSAVFLTYQDALHTTRSEHEAATEQLRIEDWQAVTDAVLDESLSAHLGAGSVGEALLAAFGDAGGHVRDDALTYDGNSRPLTLRRRIFASAAAAAASTPGSTGEGEIMTITISAAHVDAAEWQTLLRRRTS